MTPLFLLLQVFWPLCCLIAFAFHIEFHIYSETVYFILISIVSLILWKMRPERRSLWAIAVFPITALVCVGEMLFLRSVLAIPSALVRCGCAYAMLSSLPDKWYTWLTKGLSMLLIIGMIGIGFFDLTFGRIGKTTVIESLPSPDQSRTAQLIDDDQGALGGSTLVRIVHKDILPLGFAGFRPMTRTIFCSSWGEFETTSLSWLDDSTLLVNDTPHTID